MSRKRRPLLITIVLLSAFAGVATCVHRDRQDTILGNRVFAIKCAVSSLPTWVNNGGLTTYEEENQGALLSWRAWMITEMNPISQDCWSVAAWNAVENECLRRVGAFSWFDHDSGDIRCVGIIGEDTLFDPDARPGTFRELPRNLIVLVEIDKPGTHWMEPFDLTTDAIDEAANQSGTLGSLTGRSDDVLVVFADEQIWHLEAETPLSLVRPFCRRSSAAQSDRKALLRNYCINRYPGFGSAQWDDAPQPKR